MPTLSEDTLPQRGWTLERFAYLPAGVIGELHIPGYHDALYTVERPWLNNKRFVSCIPEGTYPLVHHQGTKWPSAIRLENVPGRYGILIHSGTLPQNFKGCIGVGQTWYVQDMGVPGLHKSPEAFRSLLEFFLALDFPTSLTITHTEAVLAEPA